MTWLSWRQARTQISVLLAAAVALALTLAVTGPHLTDLFAADPESFLARIAIERVNQFLYTGGTVALYVVPPVVGAFWGAPLVARELEAGTHRLVWNQSITRHRWLANKLGFAALATVAVTGLIALAVTWWAAPIDEAIGQGRSSGPFTLPRIHPVLFGARGVVPIGYALLALAVGVTAGLVLRRSVPAIGVTLAVMVAIQLAVPLLVRSHLATPHRETMVITAANLRGMMVAGDDPGSDPGSPTAPVRQLTVQAGGPNDWMVTNRTLDPAGHRPKDLPGWVSTCGTFETTPAQQSACFTRLTGSGYRQSISYQPGSNFWTLQWRETALLLGVALLLSGFCFRRIRWTV